MATMEVAMNIFKFEVKHRQKTALLWTLISGFFSFYLWPSFLGMKESGMQELVMNRFDAFSLEFMSLFAMDQGINFKI